MSSRRDGRRDGTTAGKTAEAAQCAEYKKYELTEETKTLSDGTVVHRIRALRKFPINHHTACGLSPDTVVFPDTLGGYVESEANLSHDGNCWVSEEAMVYGRARVLDNAHVMDHSKVCDYAIIRENAIVSGSARVFGRACVKGVGVTSIRDYASICEMAIVGGGTDRSRTIVTEHATVAGRAEVVNTCIYGNATIDGNAFVGNPFREHTGGRVTIGHGLINAINNNIRITKPSDIVTIHNFWSSGSVMTFIPQTGVWAVGCFNGTGKELIAKAYKYSKLNGKCYKLTVKYVEKILKLLAKNGGVA